MGTLRDRARPRPLLASLDMATQRTYSLGADVYSGFIPLEDGTTIFIEYNTKRKEVQIVGEIGGKSLKLESFPPISPTNYLYFLSFRIIFDENSRPILKRNKPAVHASSKTICSSRSHVKRR